MRHPGVPKPLCPQNDGKTIYHLTVPSRVDTHPGAWRDVYLQLRNLMFRHGGFEPTRE